MAKKKEMITLGGYEVVDKKARETKIDKPSITSVGQIMVVKTTDENGTPTEWETVDFSQLVGLPAKPLSSIMTFDSTAYYHINVDDIPDGYTYYYNDCCTDATSNLQLITFTKDGYDDVSNVMYSSDKLPFLISKVGTGALHVTLYSRDGYRQIKYSTDGTVTKGDYVQFISKSEVLSKYNTTEYTPTEDYHPATKKYVDDKKLSNFKNDLWGEEKELFLTLTQDDFEKTYHNMAMIYLYTCSRTETLDFLTDVDSIDITGVFDGVCINKTENATFSDETYRDSSFGEDNNMYSFEIYKTDSGFTLSFNSDNEFSDFTIEIYKAVLTKIPAKYLDLSGISIDTTAIEEEIDALTEEVNAL